MEDQKKELFRIGEVSKLFHISVGILRHYDKMGLLKPEYTDQETGYRYYGIRQFECLNTIRYLRLLDMPLEEIGDFLERYGECAIICDEIGNGIVPGDRFEREYRERTGRILIDLAARAERVERVICGIGQRIK